MASAIYVGQSLYSVRVNKAVESAYCTGTRNLATLAIRSHDSMRGCRKGLVWTAAISRPVSSLRLDKQQRIGPGSFFRNIAIVQTARRVRSSAGVYSTRAGIKKKIKKAVDDFEVSLQNGNAPELQDDVSQLAVSLPLALASFEGLFLVGWVSSLRGLLPGSSAVFAAADLILCGIMFANCVMGWYAWEHSSSEIEELRREKSNRKVKEASHVGLFEIGFSVVLGLFPFVNLFLWLRFASRQKHLTPKAKAALVANAFIYEGPRLFTFLLLLSGGLRVFLQVGVVSSLAVACSGLHRPVAEAHIKNEKVLMEVSRAKRIGGKKGQNQKPNLKEISAEEKERIDRMRELEEFDMLLAQSSPRDTAAFSVNAAKPKEWSVGETMEWLGQQGLARYATVFAENNIDGQLLLQLTNDELRDELKILSFGDRKKLELLIQQLKEI